MWEVVIRLNFQNILKAEREKKKLLGVFCKNNNANIPEQQVIYYA